MDQKSCNGTIHTIKSGDTLYKLSGFYKVPLAEILRANPYVDVYNLQIGERICIPNVITGTPTTPSKPIPPTTSKPTTPSKPVPPMKPTVPSKPTEKPVACDGMFHVIKSGDTFYKLSLQYHVPLDAILRANPYDDPYNLQIGQRVCIPKVEVKPEPPVMPPIKPIPPVVPPIKPVPPVVPPVKPIPPVVPPIKPVPPVVPPIKPIPPVVPPVKPIPPIMPPVKPVPPVTPPMACDGMLYTIKAGDTLYKLSLEYKVPLAMIMRANPNVDVYNLQIGQQVCIPRIETEKPVPPIMPPVKPLPPVVPPVKPIPPIMPPVKPVPPVTPPMACNGRLHTIKAGDTLYKLSIEYKVPLAHVMRANPNVDVYNLQIGQLICIPKMEEVKPLPPVKPIPPVKPVPPIEMPIPTPPKPVIPPMPVPPMPPMPKPEAPKPSLKPIPQRPPVTPKPEKPQRPPLHPIFPIMPEEPEVEFPGCEVEPECEMPPVCEPECEMPPVCQPECEMPPVCEPECVMEPVCEVPMKMNTKLHTVQECEVIGDILAMHNMTLEEFFMLNDVCDVCLKPCTQVKVLVKDNTNKRCF